MAAENGSEPAGASPTKWIEGRETVTVRFAGDSGDGMQLTGGLFSSSTALSGHDLATFPDFPAEIRAPAGTLPGVSAYQVNFSSTDIFTPGDRVDTLVVMNAAALKVNLPEVEKGGNIIVNQDGFGPNQLKLAKYETNPLEDRSLAGYRLFEVPITQMTRTAVESVGLTGKDADRCKNFFALGIVYWLYDRPLELTVRWLGQKFADNSQLREANELALKAGYHFGETAEYFQNQYKVGRARLEPGLYRKVRGNEAMALGMIAAAHKAGKPLFYASYPITPASDILQELSKHKDFGVKTFQAEDEIAAMAAVIGAAYGGVLAATATSGPGMALKTEALGLACMLELPCVIINVQRGGPSTGLPTKTEQADLFQAVLGRNGEAPIPVLAAKSPSDCFATAYEAFRIAVRYMTPVILLSEGYTANSSEPWKVPNADDLPKIEIKYAEDPAGFQPYARNEDLARPWAIPGTPALAHRIGGLEKRDVTGDICYEPLNHQRMCELRAAKVDKIAESIPEQTVNGPERGKLLVVSWGGSFGAVHTAVEQARQKGLDAAHAHLRYLRPFPANLGDLLSRYETVLVPELNLGQLQMLLRARYLVNVQGLHKVQGKPFTIREVLSRIEEVLWEE